MILGQELPNPHFENKNDIIVNEVKMLDELILSSQKSLKNLIAIKELIQKYQGIQKKYLDNPNDNTALYQMIKAAHTILEAIKESKLTPLFDPAFLSELTIISKPATKLGIPKL